MKERYLEVTFRKGKPIAAYLYLPRRPGSKSARTTPAAAGILVDFSSDGSPIGIEITAPEMVTVERINAVLSSLGLEGIAEEELSPLEAA